VLRVSAAGNSGVGHYQAMFRPGISDGAAGRHDFGGGDTLLRFSVPAGFAAVITLQWADRFGSASDDYNLFVRRTDGIVITASILVQDGNDDPFEAVIVRLYRSQRDLLPRRYSNQP